MELRGIISVCLFWLHFSTASIAKTRNCFALNWRHAEKPPDGVAPPKAYTCHAQQHKGACKIISWALILGWFWSLNHFQSTLDSWQLQQLHPWNFTWTPNKNRVIKRIYIHSTPFANCRFLVCFVSNCLYLESTCILNFCLHFALHILALCQPAGDLAESLRGGPKRHRRDRKVLTVETMLRYLDIEGDPAKDTQNVIVYTYSTIFFQNSINMNYVTGCHKYCYTLLVQDVDFCGISTLGLLDLDLGQNASKNGCIAGVR